VRAVFRIAGVAALLVVLLPAMAGGWFYFSSSGLPDVQALKTYTPQAPEMSGATGCIEARPVSPLQNMKPVLPALYAVEGMPDLSLLQDTGFTRADGQNGHYAIQIARRLMCPSREDRLVVALRQIRTAVQIHRRFGAEERAAIYLNMAYFGSDQQGIVGASQRLFGVTPEHLTTPQSALLVGLISRPEYYSPYKHPDRALARRNQVLELMKARGALNSSEANAAEDSTLGVR
jgi:membrane carboxypeptidase/penicillin-binding protein